MQIDPLNVKAQPLLVRSGIPSHSQYPAGHGEVTSFLSPFKTLGLAAHVPS